MLAAKIIASAVSASADAKLYVDDVFSTYLYTGNGSTQTITNGIDLAGKGGLVWTKERSSVGFLHQLYDSARGISKLLISNNTSQETTTTEMSSFNSTGYTVSGTGAVNYSGSTFVGWTFREAAKFFDMVTYTGTASARTIAHSLGVAPGMVIIKRTDTSSDWQVYSNGLTSAAYSMQLNLTNAQASAPTVWNSTAPTSSVFSVGTDATVNASGGTYVAYLYAHDTSSTGIIQCGSYVGNGSIINGPTVNLGWEPQYILIKNSIGAGTGWRIVDNMRGMTNNTGYTDEYLYANTNGAGSEDRHLYPSATGFKLFGSDSSTNGNGLTYIYMAIRMPNKPPTSGTQVYNAIARTGTGAAATVTGVGFAPDLVISKSRSNAGLFPFIDRLRGKAGYLTSTDTTYEIGISDVITSFNMDGVSLGADTGTTGFNYSTTGNAIISFFKRAPGFFDEVCYTGTGVANSSFNHNLGVRPELMIIKARTSTGSWITAANITATTYSELYLDTTQAQVTGSPMAYSDGNATIGAAPTATTFGFGYPYGIENASATTYVAYLFATLAGISKVGSYTGNGSSQTINCGFAASARFVLIKCTSAAGDWYVWDTARGIVSANDPHLSLNTTAAEVTTDDSVDPYSAGFAVNQVAATNINVASATYIFLAIS